MSEERPRGKDVEAALGHTFADRELLRVALTHRSYSNERDEDENYERLEFLGDSVLGLVAARWLYHRFPEKSEGELAKLKGFLVSARSLAAYARAIDLGPEILLGVGEDRSGGRAKSSILCDVVESLIGAVYVDAGFDAAREVVEPLLEHALEERSRGPHADFKTALQERTQARGWGLPKYRVAEESGPDHEKEFTVECSVDGRTLATARGRSKKRAAQAAAAEALEKLDRW